jgi:hypothetical protein
MAKTLQFKRFSSTILANTTGAIGELIIDSTKNIVTVHDGSTPGGWPVARESVINAINNAQSINIQQSRDTANLALVQANLAFVQINADLNLQGGLNSANAKIALLQNQVYANTNVASYLTSRGINTYGDSNVTSYLNSANANISMLIGIQTTQNTNITTANNAAWAAFNKANSALANTSGTFGGDLNVAGTMNVNNILTVTTLPPASSPSITTITTQNYNLVLQAVSNTWTFVANGTLLFPDNTIQRTAFTGSAIDQTARNSANTAVANTSAATNLAQASFNFANTISAGSIDTLARTTANASANLAQASFNFANTISAGTIDTLARTIANTSTNNIVIIQGVDTTQNTRITNVENTANAAYAKANTNISSNLTFSVTNSGTSDWLIDGVTDPTLTLYRGVTYSFNINATGHPFYIQTVSGAYSSGNVYTSGVTGGGTQVGTLSFTVPLDAPNNLYYVCQMHPTMAGTFSILNLISTINTQNTNITTANNAAWAAYAAGNTNATNIISVNAYSNSAYAQANTTAGGLITANANIALLQGSMTTANANIALILGVQTTQNTNINAAAQTVPQNAQATNYTLQLTDVGKHIYYTQASNTILYIPTTSNVTFANGSTIMIVSRTSSSANVTVSPNTGVTMYLAGNTTSASRNVTTYGMATLIQVAANTWFINGTGVS